MAFVVADYRMVVACLVVVVIVVVVAVAVVAAPVFVD